MAINSENNFNFVHSNTHHNINEKKRIKVYWMSIFFKNYELQTNPGLDV